jgi:arsenite oxidase small subunit
VGPVDDSKRLEPHEPDAVDPQQKTWEGEFPYHWDADELVSRRNLLHFAVYTSGTLFMATGLLAVLGRLRAQASTTERKKIASRDSIAPGGFLYFNYPGPRDQAVLLRLTDGTFVAYSQTCTHLSCSVYYQREQNRLFCPCHEGVFDPSNGQPVAGPPVRPLTRVKLESDGANVFAIGVEA